MLSAHTLGTEDPGNSPAGQAEALGKPINNQNIVLINILDIFGGGNRSSIAVSCVVVARVKLVTDKRCAATTNILNFSQLGISDNAACGIARVRGQNDRGAASNFLCNLVGVNVVAILLIQRDGNGRKLYKDII